jgi:hypothetical protein
MSLWLERHNELNRYHTYRQEAEQHRLTRQEQTESKNAQKILARVMHWLGSCLLSLGHGFRFSYLPAQSLFERIVEKSRQGKADPNSISIWR